MRWEDTRASKRYDPQRPAYSWFRVFKHNGSYVDVPATMSESTGHKMKKRAYQLYDAPDVKAVVVLNESKTRVMWSVRNTPKRRTETPPVDEVMTMVDALAEIDNLPLAQRLNTTDVQALAEYLMTKVNEAFAIGRLDKEVVG